MGGSRSLWTCVDIAEMSKRSASRANSSVHLRETTGADVNVDAYLTYRHYLRKTQVHIDRVKRGVQKEIGATCPRNTSFSKILQTKASYSTLYTHVPMQSRKTPSRCSMVVMLSTHLRENE